jgi:tRNA (cytidine/uridine-2'-O-)-methyltransferase
MPIPAMFSQPPDPPFQVVLVRPQIPPNTGNVARTCAVTGSRLHLVGPLGFSLGDAQLRRAGLDYWKDLAPTMYTDWLDFEARALRGRTDKLHLFAGRGAHSAFGVRYAPGDFLAFGSEDLGLPPALLEAYPDRTRAIPMLPGARSLNLAVAAGIALYEAFRSNSG